MQDWLKDVSPSPDLRQRFQHDPEKWDEFQKHYRMELVSKPQSWELILEALKKSDITLLYSARDTEKNSTNLLKAFLQEWLARNGYLSL